MPGTRRGEWLGQQWIWAFLDRDLDAIKGFVAPDVVWHEAGSPDQIRGRDAVLARFGEMTSTEIDTSGTELHDLMANDEHVVAMIRASFRYGDQESPTRWWRWPTSATA